MWEEKVEKKTLGSVEEVRGGGKTRQRRASMTRLGREWAIPQLFESGSQDRSDEAARDNLWYSRLGNRRY
jgi:hypothetical protein